MAEQNAEIPAPECCDMRGMLSFLILWLLLKKPMYGQEIAEEISKRKGAKPNPGTIYPALKDLRKQDLISSKKTGRVTTYQLTDRGREGIKKACKYFCRAYGEIFQEQRCQTSEAGKHAI
jgi:PadR family transcriptional regulator PadR